MKPTNGAPKYLVRFSNVAALLCYEETCAFDRGYEFDSEHPAHFCAYRWIDSPWLKSYSALPATRFRAPQEELHHYVILGGDSIAEVIALGEPILERIDGEMVLETKHVI